MDSMGRFAYVPLQWDVVDVGSQIYTSTFQVLLEGWERP